jgi:hypothetical protein
MTWQWVQDSEWQGRAVCPELGLALLVVMSVEPLYWWRYRGACVETEADGWWN